MVAERELSPEDRPSRAKDASTGEFESKNQFPRSKRVTSSLQTAAKSLEPHRFPRHPQPISSGLSARCFVLLHITRTSTHHTRSPFPFPHAITQKTKQKNTCSIHLLRAPRTLFVTPRPTMFHTRRTHRASASPLSPCRIYVSSRLPKDLPQATLPLSPFLFCPNPRETMAVPKALDKKYAQIT